MTIRFYLLAAFLLGISHILSIAASFLLAIAIHPAFLALLVVPLVIIPMILADIEEKYDQL